MMMTLIVNAMKSLKPEMLWKRHVHFIISILKTYYLKEDLAESEIRCNKKDGIFPELNDVLVYSTTTLLSQLTQ